MTRPLYYDSTLFTFTGTVTHAQGQEVALDATALYPDAGGQAADTGTLRWDGGEARVTGSRRDKTSGLIWHTLDGAAPPVGDTVRGEVDADRRWRHMQRHSAEHLLAQAFVQVNPVFEVVAVNMNAPECTIDLNGDPAESHVRAAEQLLREMLGRGDLTLDTPVVPEQDLPRHPLRRQSKVRGDTRLVIYRQADGTPFDVSACGGTHVPRASMAAPVVILRTERIKGGVTRVTFMAGEEAGTYLSGVYADARRLAQGFSVPVERLPERVEALTAERAALAAQLDALHATLARTQRDSTPAETHGTVRLRVVTLTDPAGLQAALTDLQPGEVVTAVTETGRVGIGSAHPDVNAGTLLRAALTESGGKGGGRPELAQGSTPDVPAFTRAVRASLMPA
ncbi:alanyl-tRNA editing protein [Deinococcus radiotolerans]|uniref:Serine-tRNA(Ala) deacylase n=1 Tax=Deinococcus radiotolerans TaxID=1309407 RepID=A0ABQ2FER0_9DEIO|nr:DHHA1 domain-containing protein [Deinococcus radiotolerans]GGK90563.1 serine-tRNA(Ala) deacylase [Deinococcus radiotolerans]